MDTPEKSMGMLSRDLKRRAERRKTISALSADRRQQTGRATRSTRTLIGDGA